MTKAIRWEMVPVLWAILPASIEVAPYSPKERAKVRMVPEAMPGPASGMITRQKNSPLAHAQCASRIDEIYVHLFKGGAGVTIHQRQGNDRGGNHAAEPSLDDFKIKCTVEPGAERAFQREQQQQEKACHGGSHHHGQR